MANIFIEHKHKCRNCKTVWEHNPREMVNGEEAHHCPVCDNRETGIYNGDEPATCVNLGQHPDGVDYMEKVETFLAVFCDVHGYTREEVLKM